MESVRVFAPATVSNVNCGFDVLGFAMDGPGDEVQVSLTSTNQIKISSILPETINLPTSPEKNTAGVAISSFLKALGSEQGVDIALTKNLPLGSGIGSSGASAVAALVGINHLMGSPMSRDELIVHAMEAERVACGSAHADNVAPALLGGFVLIRGYNPLDVVKIPIAIQLWCVVVHPGIELKTSDSRKVLKKDIPLKDLVTQTGNIAGLVVGLMKPDSALISRCLVDVVAEPLRTKFIPGFTDIKQKAKEEGALGSGISGSGPSIFALCESKLVAENVGVGIQNVFESYQVKSQIFISPISETGARILR
ncbi:MAG: homoserine kinase [Cyclobacteriaceae bacterium]